LSAYNTWIPVLREFQREYYGEAATLPFPPFISGKAINFGTGEGNSQSTFVTFSTGAQFPSNFTVSFKGNTKTVENNPGRVFDAFDIYILMGDMKSDYGFRTADRMVGLGLAEVTLIMQEYAKIHALSWAYKVKNGIKSLESKFTFLKLEMCAEDLAMFEKMQRASIQQAYDSLTTVVTPEESAYLDGLLGLKSKVKEIMESTWIPGKSPERLDGMLRVKNEKDEKLEQEDAGKMFSFILGTHPTI